MRCLPEKGIVGPGDVVVGADSHTCTYGGLGAFRHRHGVHGRGRGHGVGRDLVQGTAHHQGQPDRHPQASTWEPRISCSIRSVSLGVSGALYKALEYGGEVVDDMSIEGRMTIANMAIEAGGKVGLFPVDQKTHGLR